MGNRKYVKSDFEFIEDGEKVKGYIEGYTEIHFWEHDLKVKAILGLLNTIDYKDYYNESKYEMADEHLKAIIEAANLALNPAYEGDGE